MQLELREVGPPKISFSEPIDPNNLPKQDMPAEPQRPRQAKWYHRLFKFWGNNRRICEEHDAYPARHREWQEQCEAVRAPLKACAEKIAEAYGQQRAEDALQTERVEQQAAQKKYVVEKKLTHTKDEIEYTRAADNLLTIYGPKPERHEEWAAYGAYSHTQRGDRFSDLKELTLPNVRIGDGAVTEREFGALALFAAHAPQFGTIAMEVRGEDAARDLADIQKAGYSEQEAKEIIADGMNEMYTRTMMATKGKPRANSGQYFQDIVQPARENAQKALEAYQQGDKTQLAAILVDTVRCAGPAAIGGSELPVDLFAYNHLALDAIDLMERDPALREMTKQQYEAHENAFHQNHPNFPEPVSFDEQIKRVRQIRTIEAMQEKKFAAQTALLEACLQGKELPEAEQTRYVKDILTYNIVEQGYANNRTELEDKGKVTERNKAYQEQEARDVELATKTGNMSMIMGLTAVRKQHLTPKPEIMDVLDNPQAMEKLGGAIDKLIERDGLAKAPLQTLAEGLTGMHAPYSEKALAEKLQQVNAPQQPHNDQPQAR